MKRKDLKYEYTITVEADDGAIQDYFEFRLARAVKTAIAKETKVRNLWFEKIQLLSFRYRINVIFEVKGKRLRSETAERLKNAIKDTIVKSGQSARVDMETRILGRNVKSEMNIKTMLRPIVYLIPFLLLLVAFWGTCDYLDIIPAPRHANIDVEVYKDGVFWHNTTEQIHDGNIGPVMKKLHHKYDRYGSVDIETVYHEEGILDPGDYESLRVYITTVT